MWKTRRVGNIHMEDAKIIFRNFTGREDRFNREGDRNFCIELSEDLAEQLSADGWNVKGGKVKEDGEVTKPYLPVAVSYKKIPPHVAMITHRGKTILEEGMLDLLDKVDIATADLTVNPFEWAVSGNSGIKAYLRTLYIVVREDPIVLKYKDVPEFGPNSRPALESGPSEIRPHYDFDGELIDPRRELES